MCYSEEATDQWRERKGLTSRIAYILEKTKFSF